MSLLGSLGLDDVSADPNDVPVGKYDGEIIRSEYVLQEEKDQLSHAITYKVTEGDQAGAQKQQWYTLYSNPRNAEGNFPEKVEDIKAAKPALSDKQKSWYKKLYVDLKGIPEEEVSKQEPGVLVGAKVTFGVALRNGYKNINFVEPRQDAVAGPVEVNTDADPFSTSI